jgi:hypothetical protein
VVLPNDARVAAPSDEPGRREAAGVPSSRRRRRALTANASSVDFDKGGAGGAAQRTARAFIQKLELHEGPAVLPSNRITKLGARTGQARVLGAPC